MTTKKKKKPGRPAFEITEEVLERVETLAGQGLTNEQIARCIGISVTTLCDKKNKFPQFSEAIKNGMAKGIEQVTNALMQGAMEGNPTCQIFYLKNRAPEHWRDRRDVEHTGHISQTIEHRSVSETDSRIEDLFGNGKDQHPAPPVSH